MLFSISKDKFVDLIYKNDNIFLFCLVYLIYNINCRDIGSGDTVPASLLPFSLLEYHNLYLDKFQYYYTNNTHQVWFLREIKGHYLSSYPIVTPLLITLLYIIPYIYLKLNGTPIDMFHPGFSMAVSIMQKLSASLIATISVVFVYLSLKELVDKKTAAIVALIYAFATNTWTISSQALWQHGLVELLLSMSIFFVLKNERHSSNKLIVLLGILSGLFVFNRPIDSIILISVIYYVFALKDKKIIYYVISFFVSSAPFLLYNLYFFGSLFGGYSALLPGFDLSSDMINRLMGLLISPSRGLFIYTPIMLLSILGYLKVQQISNKRIKNFLLILGLSCLVQLFAYSAFVDWWAGGCYGPRFLTGMLPASAIFLGLFIKDINLYITKKNIFVICTISLLLVWSVFVQFVGAFYYPNGDWDGNPNVDQHPEKLWDWKDTQIIRTFNAGMISPENRLKNIKSIINLVHLKDISKYEIIQTNGWHGLELWNDMPFRWMESNATFVVPSPDNRTASLSLRALSFFRPRSLEIYAGDEMAGRVAVPSSDFINVTVHVRLAKGPNTVRLHVPEGCERPRDITKMKSQDARCMSIGVQNVTVT
jgi:hypothetical protein